MITGGREGERVDGVDTRHLAIMTKKNKRMELFIDKENLRQRGRTEANEGREMKVILHQKDKGRERSLMAVTGIFE